MSWNILKKAITDVIKTNGNEEITGQNLQNTLVSMVNALGDNSTFAGFALPTTNPGNPDGPVFYLANVAGVYSNFSGYEVKEGEAVVLNWDGSGNWSKHTLTTGAGGSNSVKDLGGITDNSIAFEYLANLDNLVTKTGDGAYILDKPILYSWYTGSGANLAISLAAPSLITQFHFGYGGSIKMRYIQWSLSQGVTQQITAWNDYAVTSSRAGFMTPSMLKILEGASGVMGGNAQVIEWSHTHNMNDYKEAGTYRIKGERTGNPLSDNLPIMNQGSGHTIDGILYVFDSSLTIGSGKEDDCTVTQFLILSNRVGGQEGDMYMRSAYGVNKNSLTWKPWEKYQTNMEVGCVSDDATHDATTLAPINSNGLKTFVDNGMYSGVYLTQEALSGDYTKAETFVMVVINNYAAAGDNKTITQIKFAVATNGTYNQEYRTLGADGFWSKWNNEMATVTIVNDLTTGGADKALSAEMGKSMYEILQDSMATVTSSSYSVSNGVRNFNLFPRINGVFDSNLKWFNVSDAGNHIVIQVRPNDLVYIASNGARVAFARSYTCPVLGGKIDCSKVNGFQLAKTTIVSGAGYFVPEDCNFLIVQTFRDGTEYNFTEFTINEHNLLVDQTELLPLLKNTFAIGEKVTIEKQANYTGGYVNLIGLVAASPNYGIQYIDVVKGDYITIYNYTTPEVATISIIDDEEKYIPLISGSKAGYQFTTFLADFTGRIAVSGRYAEDYTVNITKTSTQIIPPILISQMQSEIAGLGQGYNHQAGEIVKLYDACHIRNKVVNYSTIFYGQIVDGVVTITPTHTRWIYYFPVKSGDKVYFSGTISSNKGIAYGYYAEEPKEGVAAIDFGEVKDNGQAFRYIDISNDGFFGVSYHKDYTSDLEIGFLLPVNEFPLHELKDDYRPTKIKYIPHRGIRDSEIPENTTYSIMFAALYGIKYAECDVRYTSDGVGVVMHDTTINRTMYNKDLTTIQESVAIADNTFETLSQYVYKSTNPIYRTELQTMKEYIDSCAQWDVCPIIQGGMSDEDLEYCMLKLGDNWICYGGNFAKVRAYSPNVLCLTSASYDSVDTMISDLKKIGGRVGLSRLYNDQLTDDYISACKANGWEVMASYAYQEQNIPDAIRRGVTIVLADNMGKETNKILASSLSDWASFTHEGTVANGVLNLSAGQTLTYNLSEKGSYKIYAQFSGQGSFNLPTYGDSGELERKDFAMANNVFQYVFLVTTGGHDIIITASTEMAISRLIVFHE